MQGLIVQVLIVALVAVFCGWLVTRAWRSRRALVKWLGVLLAGLLTLIFALATVLGAVGTYKLYVPPYTDPYRISRWPEPPTRSPAGRSWR